MIATIATLFLLLMSAAGTARAVEPAAPVLAIRNATIHVGDGTVIAKGTVVVRNGLIEAVGPSVTPPADAWLLEGIGVHVYPGLTDALSSWGIPKPSATTAQGPTPRGPEDRPSNASWVNAQDLIDPAHATIAAARDAGFTSAIVFPAANNVFAGQGAVVNLAGDKPGKMAVAAPVAQQLTLTTTSPYRFPGSLMGVISYIRQIYLDADFYAAQRKAYDANPRGMRRPAYDRALEGVLQSPRLLLPATWAKEFDRMASLAAELKRPYVIYGAHHAYDAIDALQRGGAPVLVSLKWPERDKDSDPELREPLRVLELREKAATTPAALQKAGIRFAFYSDGVEKPSALRAAVKKAIDAGLPPEQAVRALTLSAAEIYNVADRLGSIEPGKIANLTVSDGDLFQPSTKVRFVVIDGVKYEPAASGSKQDDKEKNNK